MKTNLSIPLLALLALGLAAIGQVSALSPDFSINTSCDYIAPTGCGSYAIITVASLNGFSGTVTLTTTTSPSTGITPHLNPTSLSIPSGGNANSTLTISATCSSPSYCFWLVNVTGTSGTLSHTVQVAVCRGHFCPY